MNPLGYILTFQLLAVFQAAAVDMVDTEKGQSIQTATGASRFASAIVREDLQPPLLAIYPTSFGGIVSKAIMANMQQAILHLRVPTKEGIRSRKLSGAADTEGAIFMRGVSPCFDIQRQRAVKPLGGAMDAVTVRAMALIAVVAEDTIAWREVVSSQSSQDVALTCGMVLSTAAVNMVQRKEFPNRFVATDAGGRSAAVVCQDLSAEFQSSCFGERIDRWFDAFLAACPHTKLALVANREMVQVERQDAMALQAFLGVRLDGRIAAPVTTDDATAQQGANVGNFGSTTRTAA